MNELLGKYKNGNYTVRIFSDGTKVRSASETDFNPAFAESYDCKITDRCDGGCSWCYEGCTPYGKHGDIMNLKFFNTIHPFTELAINGNDLSHPDLIPFLEKMKNKKVIVNMTVNQVHFEKNECLIADLMEKKLINGLGVSVVLPTNDFVEKVKKYPNIVIHAINGVLTKYDVKILKNHNLKLLILGYKQLKRGDDWYNNHKDEIEKRKEWLKENLEDILDCFEVVSFDNLAIEQLDVKRLLSDEEWEEFYMGDDGNYTFYIDTVNKTFSKNSTEADEKRYPLLDNVDEMFKIIKGEKYE